MYMYIFNHFFLSSAIVHHKGHHVPHDGCRRCRRRRRLAFRTRQWRTYTVAAPVSSLLNYYNNQVKFNRGYLSIPPPTFSVAISQTDGEYQNWRIRDLKYFPIQIRIPGIVGWRRNVFFPHFFDNSVSFTVMYYNQDPSSSNRPPPRFLGAFCVVQEKRRIRCAEGNK